MRSPRFFASLRKLNTGRITVRSSSILTMEESEKLNFIFETSAGQKRDFELFLDEFSTRKVRLSGLQLDTMPIQTVEENILDKFDLLETGITTPLDLLEEFESRMGSIERDEHGIYYLEGSRDQPFLEEG